MKQAAAPVKLTLTRMASPLGEMLLVSDEAGAVCALDFADFEPRLARLLEHHHGPTTLVEGAAPTAVSQSVGVIVPCHRVIGANGSLTGYAGGVERKRWLLAHEARHAAAGGVFTLTP